MRLPGAPPFGAGDRAERPSERRREHDAEPLPFAALEALRAHFRDRRIDVAAVAEVEVSGVAERTRDGAARGLEADPPMVLAE